MLRRLRWQLTLLYLGVALGLVGLLGIGSYSILQHYLQSATNLAMQYKMATQFHRYGLQLPPELAQAEQSWLQRSGRSLPTSGFNPPVQTPNIVYGGDDQDTVSSGRPGGAHLADHGYERASEDSYDASLAAIFVLPLNSQGNLISSTNSVPFLISDDKVAYSAAVKNGSDWRTTTTQDGTRVRLLTYATDVSDPSGPILFQVGRLLNDQDRVMNEYFVGLLILASISSVLLGLGSWWLSGRTLGPAQKAWDQQQVFVANASHELRTPLTIIRATAEVGLRSRANAGQKESLEGIVQEVDYMNRLVDDLLLLSRLDARRLSINLEHVDVPVLLSGIRKEIEELASRKGISIVSGQLQGQVVGDANRLHQVLLILLDNALRFTPPGGEIRLESQADKKLVHISISDTGAGIAPEHLPHLFERFYQARPPDSDEARSNGLGLSIAKALTEAQNGSIYIQSSPGIGTQVTLAFPQA